MTDHLDAIAPDTEDAAELTVVPWAPNTEAPLETVDAEPVDGTPVLVQARPLAGVGGSALPAVQAVAVAATGFVAGAATLALVRRQAARRLARSRSAPRRAVDVLPVVGSRTFIVDVHLLAKPGQ